MKSVSTPEMESSVTPLQSVSSLNAEPNTVAMLSSLVDSLTRMHRVSDASQSFAAELDVKLRRAEDAAAARAAMQAAWEKDFEDKITRQFEAAVARAVSRRSAEYETKLRELESKLEQLESLTLAEVGSRYFSAALSFAWRGSVLLYSGLSLLVAPCTRRLPAARKRIVSLCCSSSSSNGTNVVQSKVSSKAASKTAGALVALAHQTQHQSFEPQYHHQQQQQHQPSHLSRITATASSSSVPDDITSPAVIAYMASISGKSSNSVSLGRHGLAKTAHQLPSAWKTEEGGGTGSGTISTLHSQASAIKDAESASARYSKQESHFETSFHTINDQNTSKSATAPISGGGSEIDGGSKHTTPPSLSFSPSPIPSEVHVQQYQTHDQMSRRQPVLSLQQSSSIIGAPVARRRPQRPT